MLTLSRSIALYPLFLTAVAECQEVRFMMAGDKIENAANMMGSEESSQVFNDAWPKKRMNLADSDDPGFFITRGLIFLFVLLTLLDNYSM